MREKIVYGILGVFLFLTIPLFAEESSPTDEIIIKATNVVLFQMKVNLKLTQDQMTAVEPIVASNLSKIRNLQQSLEDGAIDSSTMYSQRERLNDEENQALSAILTSDQMKVWINIQNQSSGHSHGSSK